MSIAIHASRIQMMSNVILFRPLRNSVHQMYQKKKQVTIIVILLLLIVIACCNGQPSFNECYFPFVDNCHLCTGITSNSYDCKWCSDFDSSGQGHCVSNDVPGEGDCFGTSPGMLDECDASASNLNDPCAVTYAHNRCTCLSDPDGCGYCGNQNDDGTGMCVSGTLSGPSIGTCPEDVGGWEFGPIVASGCGVPSDTIEYDFNTSFFNLSIDSDTLDVSILVDTAVHWDSTDVWSIMLRLGQGGYPTIATPLNSTSIASLAPAPTLLPSYPSWKLYFANQLNTYHDFATLNASQDAFQPLNTGGIVSSVSYVYDEGTARDVIRWEVSFNLLTVATRYNETSGCVCTFYASLDRIECVVPLTAVYRNSFDVSTTTSTILRFVILETSGQVIGIISSSISHGFAAFINRVATTTQGCDDEDVRLNVTFRLEYDDIDADALAAGPLSINDITFPTNCYALEAIAVVTPTCQSSMCTSYVTIQTECRTPTADGLVFQLCPGPETPGLMSININAKQCIDGDDECVPLNAGGISDQVHAILLYSVHTGQSIDIQYDMFMSVLNSPNLTLTEALLASTTQFSSSDDDHSSAVTITGTWFVPCVFLDSMQSRELYDLHIDTSNFTLWGIDPLTHNTVTRSFNWTQVAAHAVVHQPKAIDGQVASCEGLPGCDCFVLSSAAIVAMIPQTTAFRIRVAASFTPVGVHLQDGGTRRRLLSHSPASSSHHEFRTINIYYGEPPLHRTNILGVLIFFFILAPVLVIFATIPCALLYEPQQKVISKGYAAVSTREPA
jgi:hypothetical protein